MDDGRSGTMGSMNGKHHNDVRTNYAESPPPQVPVWNVPRRAADKTLSSYMRRRAMSKLTRLKPGFHATQRTQRKAIAYVFDATGADDARIVRKEVRDGHSWRERPKDGSGAYSWVAFVAIVALRPLRRMEMRLKVDRRRGRRADGASRVANDNTLWRLAPVASLSLWINDWLQLTVPVITAISWWRNKSNNLVCFCSADIINSSSSTRRSC